MGAKPQPCYIQIRAINNRVIMRLQCTMFSWTRNPLLAFSMLATVCFPRWRPIWPPNQPRQVLAYISVTVNNSNLMLLLILTKIWSRNRLVTFLISTRTSCSRWQPIWPSNWKKYKYFQPKTNKNFEVLLPQFVNVFSQCNEIWHNSKVCLP